eukprot:15368-Heterococcus_DN1.PRE.3
MHTEYDDAHMYIQSLLLLHGMLRTCALYLLPCLAAAAAAATVALAAAAVAAASTAAAASTVAAIASYRWLALRPRSAPVLTAAVSALLSVDCTGVSYDLQHFWPPSISSSTYHGEDVTVSLTIVYMAVLSEARTLSFVAHNSIALHYRAHAATSPQATCGTVHSTFISAAALRSQ